MGGELKYTASDSNSETTDMSPSVRVKTTKSGGLRLTVNSYKFHAWAAIGRNLVWRCARDECGANFITNSSFELTSTPCNSLLHNHPQSRSSLIKKTVIRHLEKFITLKCGLVTSSDIKMEGLIYMNHVFGTTLQPNELRAVRKHIKTFAQTYSTNPNQPVSWQTMINFSKEGCQSHYQTGMSIIPEFNIEFKLEDFYSSSSESEAEEDSEVSSTSQHSSTVETGKAHLESGVHTASSPLGSRKLENLDFKTLLRNNPPNLGSFPVNQTKNICEIKKIIDECDKIDSNWEYPTLGHSKGVSDYEYLPFSSRTKLNFDYMAANSDYFPLNLSKSKNEQVLNHSNVNNESGHPLSKQNSDFRLNNLPISNSKYLTSKPSLDYPPSKKSKLNEYSLQDNFEMIGQETLTNINHDYQSFRLFIDHSLCDNTINAQLVDDGNLDNFSLIFSGQNDHAFVKTLISLLNKFPSKEKSLVKAEIFRLMFSKLIKNGQSK